MHRLLNQSLILLSLALVPAVAAGLWHPYRPMWQTQQLLEGEVSLAEVRGWPEPILWIDARSDEAYEVVHAPGALLLNEDDWEGSLEPVLMAWQPGPPETRVVVYCDSRACNASHEVAQRLREETGWGHIYVLHGGWVELQKEAK